MTKLFFLLSFIAVSWACTCCLRTTADTSAKRRHQPPSPDSNALLTSLLSSLQNGKEAVPGIEDMLRKLALEMGEEPGDPNSGGFGEGMQGIPDLAQLLNSNGGGPDIAELLKGMGGASDEETPSLNFSALQGLVEKFLSESGTDGGLMQNFKELQNMSKGPMDLEKLASTFKSLSAALKDKGTDINSLIDKFLESPQGTMPLIAPPAELKELYSKSFEEPIGDSLGSGVVRPPPVPLSAIVSSIGTLTEQLPPPLAGAQCHALVLSGALARAPLQAGAVLGLAEQYKARDRQLRWDVVAGVNKGAISAATSLAFAPGQNGEIDWARYLYDYWHRITLTDFLLCPTGVRDLLNLPRVLSWLSDSQAAVLGGASPMTLGVSHLCDTSPAAASISNMLNQLPVPNAENAGKGRVAVVAAAKVGGGKAVWELRGLSSAQTCLVSSPFFSATLPTSQWEEGQQRPQGLSVIKPKSELDLTLAALLASNATPGLVPVVRVWNPQSQREEAYADGRLVANISVGEAARACQKKLRKEGKDAEKGHGIVLDIVGTLPLKQSEIEEQLLSITNKLKITKACKQQDRNKMPSKKFIKQIKKAFPLITIRHVIFPEQQFNLTTEYADFKNSEALLQHGRLMGWQASTLEDVE